MDIMNRYINMFKYACDMVYPYNINCRLTEVIDGSLIIRDLESKVLYDRSEPLELLWAIQKVQILESVERATEAGWVLADQ